MGGSRNGEKEGKPNKGTFKKEGRKREGKTNRRILLDSGREGDPPPPPPFCQEKKGKTFDPELYFFSSPPHPSLHFPPLKAVVVVLYHDGKYKKIAHLGGSDLQMSDPLHNHFPPFLWKKEKKGGKLFRNFVFGSRGFSFLHPPFFEEKSNSKVEEGREGAAESKVFFFFFEISLVTGLG